MDVEFASLLSVVLPLPMNGMAVLNHELLPIPPVFAGCSDVGSGAWVAWGSAVAVVATLLGVSLDLPAVAGVAEAPEMELRAFVVERS